ncbi:AAA family ATPase [Nocardia sp. XZ_19_231]|uniref:bifunctional aminoglycoside phosphotransferase/ATP-binding protein n=1 Tax=Nocardia sp. XZ_19_231 TaxID=2769252 RepID=UPI00189013FA|nr:AAA family ATPase [Nocardia sp. XZ_19_231]
MTVIDQPAQFTPHAQLRETHTGLVLLCGDRAYKTKKPIANDFLDFSTHELREQACVRELELNRRMAPDVYLGVGHFTDPLGGQDEPVLVMRRMPEDRRLSNMLRDPAESRTELSALVKMLAEFHRVAGRSADIDRAATAKSLRSRWLSVLRGLLVAPTDLLDPDRVRRVEASAMRYLDGREALMDNRIRDRRIVDGHGDLLAEDIFELPDGFRVLDCLDFDDTLRHLDCLDDVAFLAMDLEFRGHAELADRFLDEYLEATADPAPASLRDHYIAYRAIVRTKVDCIRFEQGVPEAAEQAIRHLDIALRHLDRGAIRLVLVGGLPGTGKSTVARELAERTGATVISSDHLRGKLRTEGSITGPSGEYNAGAYSAAARATVYSNLLANAHTQLANGVSVIIDASWTDPDERRSATALARELSADLIELRCVVPQSVATERITQRGISESDATPLIAELMSQTAAAWPEAVVLDTVAPIDEVLRAALLAWRGDSEQEIVGRINR